VSGRAPGGEARSFTIVSRCLVEIGKVVRVSADFASQSSCHANSDKLFFSTGTEVETDCGVRDDSSGTGYLNCSGFLFAVNKWEWEFSRFSGSASPEEIDHFRSLETTWNMTFAACSTGHGPVRLVACTICGISSRLAQAIHERHLFLLLTSLDSSFGPLIWFLAFVRAQTDSVVVARRGAVFLSLTRAFTAARRKVPETESRRCGVGGAVKVGGGFCVYPRDYRGAAR
jgi:hypothetical protein